MSEYQIYVNINKQKYFITEVDVKQEEDRRWITKLTWSPNQTKALSFSKKRTDEVLPVLARDGRDYGSVRKA